MIRAILCGLSLAASAHASDWLNIGRIGTRPAQMDVSRVTVGAGFAAAPVRLANAKTAEGTLAVHGCGQRDVLVELRHHAGVNIYRLDPAGERGVDMGGRVLCKIAEGK